MITVEDLKKEISERDYRMLTEGDDEVAVRAIDKAEKWVIARFRKCGKTMNPEDELVQQAILKRALYELYSYKENEKVAADKKEDAEDILEGVLGDCVEEKNYKPVAVSVNQGNLTPLAQEFSDFVEGR